MALPRRCPERVLLGTLALAGAALSASGCRVGKPRTPVAEDPRTSAAVQAYVGEARIVRHPPGARDLSVRKGALLSVECETAVVVRSAGMAGDTTRLALDVIGRPQGRQGARCRALPAGMRLTVSGLGSAETPEGARASLDSLLLTPEAYLRAHGIPFEPVPAPPNAPLARADGTMEEQSRARKVTRWPKAILAVDPYYHDPTGRVRYEGELAFEGAVGSDGLLRDPRLKGSLGDAHQKAVLRALSLWRYEPARAGDQPTAAHVDARLVFRIY